MSKEYREKTGSEMERFTNEDMRLHCQRPGKYDENGKPIYTTEQHHKKECDINLIIDKYDKHGVIKHITAFEAQFGDLSGMDFKEMQDKIANAKTQFNDLPWQIRERFNNNPQFLLSFMDNPDNRDEAIKLGLISNTTPPEMDGLGEHVKKTNNENPKNDETNKDVSP